ncbi:hypothetical protein EDD18DRAFT_1111209 [Armillaria luteobubalina]|uniref:Uncharacterized protein n=1 Tax=Armillaria luteobubalina TaxID=153913 RepID=A0AA39PLS4_9AGAR|nr:hypothetical protein EDD18DRAFT_1111209 [Armillaria luteobubalina]
MITSQSRLFHSLDAEITGNAMEDIGESNENGGANRRSDDLAMEALRISHLIITNSGLLSLVAQPESDNSAPETSAYEAFALCCFLANWLVEEKRWQGWITTSKRSRHLQELKLMHYDDACAPAGKNPGPSSTPNMNAGAALCPRPVSNTARVRKNEELVGPALRSESDLRIREGGTGFGTGKRAANLRHQLLPWHAGRQNYVNATYEFGYLDGTDFVHECCTRKDYIALTSDRGCGENQNLAIIEILFSESTKTDKCGLQ